jgi:hypothetical protein
VAVLLFVLVSALIGSARLVRSSTNADTASSSGHGDPLHLGQTGERPSAGGSVALLKLLGLMLLGVVAVVAGVLLWLTLTVDWPAD